MIPKETYQKSLASNLRRFIGQFRKLEKSLKTTQEFHALSAQSIPGGDSFQDYLEWSKTMLDGVNSMLGDLRKQIEFAEVEFLQVQRSISDQAAAAVKQHPDVDP